MADVSLPPKAAWRDTVRRPGGAWILIANRNHITYS